MNNERNELYESVFKAIDDTQSKIERLEKDIENANNEIKEHWFRIAVKKALMREYKRDLGLLFSLDSTNLKKKLQTQIDNILDLPQIRRIRVDGNTLILRTNRIDFYDTKGNKFKGNNYEIEMNVKNGVLRFVPFGDDMQLFESYWDKYDKTSPHPHIGKPGEYCLGNAGDMLCEYISEQDLFNSTLVVLSFLEQCNENDVAGGFVCNWTCIDEYDNELENPYNKKKMCEICETTVEPDETYTCDHCGEVMCSDCSTWIESRDVWVCESCLDDHYRHCDKCQYYEPDSKMYACDECGRDICEDCMISAEDRVFCSEYCRDEQMDYCQTCNEYTDKENVVECAYCEEYVCKDCIDETKHGLDFCSQDCLGSWEEENLEECHECGEYYKDEYIYYCHKCGKNVCGNCIVKFEGEYYCSSCKEDMENECKNDEK